MSSSEFWAGSYLGKNKTVSLERGVTILDLKDLVRLLREGDDPYRSMVWGGGQQLGSRQ